MKKINLYDVLKKEGIYYINSKLSSTRGAIATYKGITAIIVDNTQIDSKTSENTVIIQELGHYFSGSYYRQNSSYGLIQNMEYRADIVAWLEFFPYKDVKRLMNLGMTTATDIASYYDVEPSYMARCLNFYYINSNGFENDDLFYYEVDI